MPSRKVAITVDADLLDRLDRLVDAGAFPNRSRGVTAAVRELVERLEAGRFERECAKLDPAFEQAMAEEGLSGDGAEWPAW